MNPETRAHGCTQHGRIHRLEGIADDLGGVHALFLASPHHANPRANSTCSPSPSIDSGSHCRVIRLLGYQLVGMRERDRANSNNHGNNWSYHTA
jgi:hypothetical protein